MYALSPSKKATNDRLGATFKKLAVNGQLHRNQFEECIIEEVMNLAMRKAHDDTLERWVDLTDLGVLMEVWDATFGESTESITFNTICKVFEKTSEEENTEAERLVDLLSVDDALRNQLFDLEQCLQSNKDMLAASDILVEEQGEKVKSLGLALEMQNSTVDLLRKQVKELEALKTKVKNMESEHRLLKRDFDLVFATNKSVQKKMERTDLENRSLRKTIISLANQMGKIERESNGLLSPNGIPAPCIPVLGVDPMSPVAPVVCNANGFNPNMDQALLTPDCGPFMGPHMQDPVGMTDQWGMQHRPHMVWDPAVRSLVPIVGHKPRRSSKKEKDFSDFDKMNNKRKNKRKGDGGSYNNGKLISPFPRRYTSSHLPRYRRKFEMSEKSRFGNQNFV